MVRYSSAQAGADEYLTKMTTTYSNENFIIVIDHPSILKSTIYPIYCVVDKTYKFPKRSGGLLMNRYGREIVDYSRQEESDCTIILTSPTLDVRKLTDDGDNLTTDVAFLEANGTDFYDRTTGGKDDFVLIDLIARWVMQEESKETSCEECPNKLMCVNLPRECVCENHGTCC